MTDPNPTERPTLVSIGLIQRGGRYLIRQRPPGSIMAGVWEFPGGKAEPGETPQETVVRECFEETRVQVVVKRLAHQVEHRYPHGLINLTYFECEPVNLQDEPPEGSGFRWVAASELGGYRFPEANEMIIQRLMSIDPTSSYHSNHIG